MALTASLLAAVAMSEATSAPMNQFPAGGYRVSNSEPHYKPEFRGDYFEVRSETVTYNYGEVFWQKLPPVPMPQDVLDALADHSSQSLMISGFEANLMRRDADGNEVIVPAYETYNHHLTLTFRGQAEDGTIPAFKEASSEPEHMKYKVEKLEGPGWESVQQFVGAEMRGTFFYSPEGYAMRVDHPVDINIEAMLINTGKPGGGRCTFPSDECPEPATSMAPEGAMYSGLLECPCTDRIEINIFEYVPASDDTCAIAVESAQDCWAGAEEMGYTGSTMILDDDSYPSGCFALADHDNVQVGYNTAQSTVSCNQMPEDMLLVGSVSLFEESSLYWELNMITGASTYTMTGPSDVWFGFGFGAKMEDSLAFIAQADGTLQPRILGDHRPGSVVDLPLEMLSNTVEDGVRTVVFTTFPHHELRRLDTSDSTRLGGYAQEIPVIAAIGYGPSLSYHRLKASGKMVLLGNNVPECICRADPAHPVGSIGGVIYPPDCADQLLAEGNPTCSVATYEGGIQCCRDGDVLLDKDQAIPQTHDEVYVKLRVYYEPEVTAGGSTVSYYAPEGHQLEYDIPNMGEGGVHVLTVTKAAEEFLDFSDGDVLKLVWAQGHCHAPMCIRQELWNDETNELICSTDMQYGENDEPMNESGYIVGSSVCLWGEEDGLKAPVLLKKSTKIRTVKYARAENVHYGEMAGWVLQYQPTWE